MFRTFILVGEIFGLLLVPVILVRKRHPVSAWAWALTVVFIPWLGALLFLVFGAQRIRRRLRRKLYHRSRFLKLWTTAAGVRKTGAESSAWAGMDAFALRVGGSPVSEGNELTFYFDGEEAFSAKRDAIRAAEKHVHVEYFILKDDATGAEFTDLLCEKARAGVAVRLLVDAVGARRAGRLLRRLRQAGGRAVEFLPMRLGGERFAPGLRNHRKILVCDGTTAFTGGLNVANEYVNRSSRFRFWRDTHARVRGPAVLALQRVFAEDWDFAANELISGNSYYPEPHANGRERVQVVWSGPDQENNATRETFFEAMTSARRRLWIATPYLVPDSALLMALRSAAVRGADVRILTQSWPPDHQIAYWAGRYFWEELLSSGVRIYEYGEGMMHAKVVLADGAWASMGTANLDVRSIRLNFEVNLNLHSRGAIEALETAFRRDLRASREVRLGAFRRRPWWEHFAENVCRLFSPLL
ncbi:MAG: cardiolipin synthase [Verrucomicrobiae bacterium]|nr:cardiolipin synthase [Verrucomicrobiae bacterium]